VRVGLVAQEIESIQARRTGGQRWRTCSEEGGAGTGPRRYGGTELTDFGEKAAADFKREDDPRFHCETTSIIFDWTFDGPVNRSGGIKIRSCLNTVSLD
jgi:hypothetical protein